MQVILLQYFNGVYSSRLKEMPTPFRDIPEIHLMVIKPLINVHPSYYTARGQLIFTNAFSLTIMKGYHMAFIAQRAGKDHQIP